MPDRFINITDGVVMVVTDLHGDRDAFDCHERRFRDFYAAGDAQRLIFLGDLIHSYGPAHTDDSVNMILRIIALQEEFGAENVIMLLGNHEMPHIYGVSLAKGEYTFTPRFEHALGPRRAQIMAFFESLPFYARTAAGVLLTHAGPEAEVIQRVDNLRQLDHRAILDQTDAILREADDLTPLYQQYSAIYGAPYAEDAEELLAITGPSDPRYPHLLRSFMISQQSQEFKLLWTALFTQNERGLPDSTYTSVCDEFLAAFSVDAPAPQRAVVSGHIGTPGGHTLVNRHHLRLSSAAHAHPREAGEYLLLDCAHPVHSAASLIQHLDSAFEIDDE